MNAEIKKEKETNNYNDYLRELIRFCFFSLLLYIYV